MLWVMSQYPDMRYGMIGQSWCHGQWFMRFMYPLRWAGKVKRLECPTLASLRSWPMMVDCAQIGGLQKAQTGKSAMVMIYRDHLAKIIWCHWWFSHDGVDMIRKYNLMTGYEWIHCLVYDMWCAILSICCMDALLVIPQSLVAWVRIFKSPRRSSVKTRRCLLTSHRWVIKNSNLRYGHPAFVLHGVKRPVSATGALCASRPSLRSTLSIFDGGSIVVVPFSPMPTCIIVTAMCVSLWFRVVDTH